MRYYELSTNTNENVIDTIAESSCVSEFQQFAQIVQDDLLELLGKAVTCAILGKAGQQRTRVLGLLYQVCATVKVPTYFHLILLPLAGRSSEQPGPAGGVLVALDGADEDVQGADPQEGGARRLRGLPHAPPESGASPHTAAVMPLTCVTLRADHERRLHHPREGRDRAQHGRHWAHLRQHPHRGARKHLVAGCQPRGKGEH